MLFEQYLLIYYWTSQGAYQHLTSFGGILCLSNGVCSISRCCRFFIGIVLFQFPLFSKEVVYFGNNGFIKYITLTMCGFLFLVQFFNAWFDFRKSVDLCTWTLFLNTLTDLYSANALVLRWLLSIHFSKSSKFTAVFRLVIIFGQSLS